MEARYNAYSVIEEGLARMCATLQNQSYCTKNSLSKVFASQQLPMSNLFQLAILRESLVLVLISICRHILAFLPAHSCTG